MVYIIVFLWLQILFFSSCLAEDDNLVVQTSNGLLRGKLATTRNIQVRQFLGIPYAEAPVGQLRFAKPKPFGSWQGVRDAVEFGPICVQVNISVGDNEDKQRNALFVFMLKGLDSVH